MKLDPRHLEILASVVEQGGLTEGATALGKSQPSVSRSLSMLEQRLGVNLFQAGRRPLQPTKLCQVLALEGRKILDAGRAASSLIDQFKSGHSGAVRVAGSPIFMDGVVSGILASFQSEFPEVQISQSYGYPTEILSLLRNDMLDVGIVPIRTSEIPADVTARQILPGRNVIACRVGHPLTLRTGVRLKDIAEFPWIAPPPDSPLYHDLRSTLEGIGMTDFKVSFSGGSLASVTTILSGSNALTVLPYSVVFNLRRQNTLSSLPIRIGDPDRHLCALLLAENTEKPALSRFVRFIVSEFEAFARVMQRQEQNSLWRT